MFEGVQRSMMEARLLYKDRDWVRPEPYYDEKSIVRDLGLDLLFMTASKEVLYENGAVKRLAESDPEIRSAVSQVMMTPLKSEEEIRYRQHIVADAIDHEGLITGMFDRVRAMLNDWDKLGRNVIGKQAGRDNVSRLITSILEIRLFIACLDDIKSMLSESVFDLRSEGLKALDARLKEEYSDELQEKLHVIRDAVAFYVDGGSDKDKANYVKTPKIVLSCGIGEGCRFDRFELDSVQTVDVLYRDPKSLVSKVKGYINSMIPDSAATDYDMEAVRQTSAFEYETIRYVMSFTEPFRRNFESFFDRLFFQLAFYKGAVNMVHHMKRFALKYCYPNVCRKDRLAFSELKEFVMCIGQRVSAVGNTCTIEPKNLIVITGANQGGKSTFLRSIGIAQVMMQCGLPVTATGYESYIFPSLFMHFTRREDASMNSGRLAEELSRMSRIVDNLGENSLILLNESFATTTEKDGSDIAYNVIRALNEAGVKIIMVTHLLSFARKIYAENGEDKEVAFFCAERMEDGRRTYKMIQSVPELTSFGLDLYEKIIEGQGL